MSLIVDIKKQLGSFTLDVAFEAEPQVIRVTIRAAE